MLLHPIIRVAALIFLLAIGISFKAFPQDSAILIAMDGTGLNHDTSSIALAHDYHADSLIVMKLLDLNRIESSRFKNVVGKRSGRIVGLSLSDEAINGFRCGTGRSEESIDAEFARRNKIKALPEDLARLDSLQYLDLSLNDLDSIPRVVFCLKKLKALYFLGNPLRTVPMGLFTMDELVELNLAGDSLRTFPEELLRMKSLRSLDLSWNQITVLPDVPYENLTLEKLIIRNNEITVFPQAYCSCAKIKVKDYSQNAQWIETKGCKRFSKAFDPWKNLVGILVMVAIVAGIIHFSDRK
jgi:hypothetical protein